MSTNNWIYDEETYPNIFTFTIIREDGKHLLTFEISSRKNETSRLLDCLRYLKTNNCNMVGFNNLGFDYPIIHYILQKAIEYKKQGKEYQATSQELFRIAQQQIGKKFGINQNDILIRQIDLYKIHHFDNKARATSLKMLEFNMRSDNIEDLPFEVGKDVPEEEMDKLVEYNRHDVTETLKFYKETIPAIEFREKLTKQLGKDFTNANDTKVGKDYLIMKLEQSMPGSCYINTSYGRKPRQTIRDEINIADCLFDYYNFKRTEFQAILDWMKNQTITETKGVFTDIEEHNLRDVVKYANMRIKRKKFPEKPTEDEINEFKKEHPLGWIEEIYLKSGGISYWMNWNIADSLNVVIDGLEIVFGTGGVHAARENYVFKSTKKTKIESVDVTSMYPNIAIANNVYPEHLSKRFCKIYKDLYHQRKKYAKGTPENALFKLALNGSYGDSNNQYSPLYDPKYTMITTVNGQLSLCVLVEMLLEIPTVKVIMMNTDGLEYLVDIEYLEASKKVCDEWEKITKLSLERVSYNKLFLRDVNNYIGIFDNEKIKRKGAYSWKTKFHVDDEKDIEVGWHQNQSALVVPMAAEAYMLHGTDISEFICSHEDKWDFMLRTKVPRDSKLVLVVDGEDIPQQNICRYFPSKNGGQLVKIMPPLQPGGENRRIGINKEYNVKTCNDIKDFSWNLDYSYYIDQAKKLVIGE